MRVDCCFCVDGVVQDRVGVAQRLGTLEKISVLRETWLARI